MTAASDKHRYVNMLNSQYVEMLNSQYMEMLNSEYMKMKLTRKADKKKSEV